MYEPPVVTPLGNLRDLMEHVNVCTHEESSVMAIVTRPATAEYRDNFDATFGPKPKRPNECRIYNTTCPTPELCKLADPSAPCAAGQVNATSGFAPYPSDREPRYNGGQRCDMWIGPCACGAWHHGADDVLEKKA